MNHKERRKALRRRLGWIALRIFMFLATKCSLKLNDRLGHLLGRLLYCFAIRHRRSAFESLSIAFPHQDQRERKIIVKDSFLFLGKGSLEMFHFYTNPNALENIRVEGREFLDQALQSNEGVVGFSSHLGNFPLLCYKLVHLGYTVNVLARPMRDEKAGDYAQQLRTEVGLKTIFSYPRKECVNQTISVLRNNEIVIIQMDQNFGTGGVWVKFFGKLAATPVGSIVFALRTGAKLLPMYIIREGLGRHCVKIFPALDLQIRDDRDETILVNAIQCTQIIEGWVREFPGQWSWIHRRWKSRPSAKIMNLKHRIQKD